MINSKNYGILFGVITNMVESNPSIITTQSICIKIILDNKLVLKVGCH